MSHLAKICVLFFISVISKTVLCKVEYCDACAGPATNCIGNQTDSLQMDCSTFLVENQSFISRTDQTDFLELFDNEVGPVLEPSNQIGCITLTFNHATQTPSERAVKSCVPKTVFDEDICRYMEKLLLKINGVKTSCKFCENNNCNGSNSIENNKLILIVFSFIYFCKYFIE